MAKTKRPKAKNTKHWHQGKSLGFSRDKARKGKRLGELPPGATVASILRPMWPSEDTPSQAPEKP